MASENQIWEMARERLAANLPDFSSVSMDLWFGSMELKVLTESTAYFQIESDFKQNIIRTRYLDDIKKAMAEILGFEVEIVPISIEKDTFENRLAELLTKNSENEMAPAAPSPEERFVRMNNSYLTREIKADEEVQSGQVLVSKSLPDYLPEYTFDNFVVGGSNKMAYSFARTVAEHPADKSINPLFIYGNPGLGKTHLLYAITHEVTTRFPDYNIIYVKGEDFMNELIEAIALKAPVQFREKYRKADMLIVDDIQFIAGKVAAQEEFFHTFDALYESGKQIVVSSDLPPNRMTTLEQRLRSRFEQGAIADIQAPDLELRVAIFKRKAQGMGINVPNDVLMYLGTNITENIRQIEGALKKMRALSFIQGEDISLDHAVEVVKVLKAKSAEAVTPERIIAYVSQKYKIPAEDITSRKKQKNIAWARHIAVFLMHDMLDMSYVAIGKYLNRDHTTIMSSVENIDNEIQRSPEFGHTIDEIKKDIRNG